ncbi:MAG: hypothetical protein M1834_008405 [Cirrosporium novae-zelandiae]|nr:MAG: hypothetical protein M1834_008405 [Cirrosporium novae-zelandiae]
MESTIVPIPSPPALPFLGDLVEKDPEFPLGSLIKLVETYGPILRSHLPGHSRVIVSSQALVNEVCDESRFTKQVAGALEEIRNGAQDGLFTAYGPQEENWGIAHRILVPAFGPLSIRGMFDEMHDVASQLTMKWARHGPSYVIPVSDDFTRLTLDTLALCTMGYRFNSYYHEEMHPFITAMGDFLSESGNRSMRPSIVNPFYRQSQRKYDADIAILRKTSDDVIKARRQSPNDRKDLLNSMLNGRDPRTGKTLSDDSITNNMITFLIAGHETTSGLLSFSFYYLLKNPAAYQRAQAEIDNVIGKGPIKVEQLSKLPFIAAIFRETLRLHPPVVLIQVSSPKTEIIGGKYQVEKNEPINAFLHKLHRDPAVYGEDAETWRPERMLDEPFEKLNKEYPNCWKPFGNGSRACIGRPFAWQEALLVVAMLLQNFNFELDDPSYQLRYKQTLTVKPKDFKIHATLRNKISPTQLEQNLASITSGHAAGPEPSHSASIPLRPVAKGPGLHIFYGSNTGTCEALAQRLAGDAASHGFQTKVIGSLDSAKEFEKSPTGEPVIIITASYEGQPPDNAGHFVAWLESLKGDEMKDVIYSVFACGHHDWASTFHRIPNLVDDLMEKRGGKRIAPIGRADAGEGDMFSDFENWEDNILWPALKKQYAGSEGPSDNSLDSGIQVKISSPRPSQLRQDMREARIVSTRTLTAPGAPEKNHIEIELPSDLSYSVGDYLAILPLNPKDVVLRAIRRFGLSWDCMVSIISSQPTTLPTDHPISAFDLLTAYVELQQPATKRNTQSLVEATADVSTKEQLTHLSTTTFETEITQKRLSILDLLERFPTIALPLGSFLQMLPPMRIRQYSISSSPLSNPTRATLTYRVLDAPALKGSGRHIGIASNYLSQLTPGDKLHISIRPSHIAFHLPSDPENIPIICIAAGTGIAPFVGFIQERAAQIGAGRTLAPALLFFGCRDPAIDDLYAERFARWETMGAVSMRRAYSRKPEASEGCKYVQDRLWRDREEVEGLWERNARVFVCGHREVGEAVKGVSIRMAMEARGVGEGKAEEWFEGIRNTRYSTDVFA